MMKAAVLGSPISHSLSPLLHRTAYEKLNFAGSYKALEVNEESFPIRIQELLDLGFSNFSLTMPLKEIGSSVADFIDEDSRRINSVNTLYKESGSIQATSTDLMAFKSLLKKVEFESVAIIGGGGTARAAVGALAKRVGSIDLLIRDQKRLSALKIAGDGIAIKGLPLDSDISNYDLVIATTPSGVTDLLAEKLNSVKGLLIESLYKPYPTDLLKKWQVLGGRTLSGLDLLVEQALYQISIFTGIDYDFATMRELLLSTGLKQLI